MVKLNAQLSHPYGGVALLTWSDLFILNKAANTLLTTLTPLGQTLNCQRPRSWNKCFYQPNQLSWKPEDSTLEECWLEQTRGSDHPLPYQKRVAHSKNLSVPSPHREVKTKAIKFPPSSPYPFNQLHQELPLYTRKRTLKLMSGHKENGVGPKLRARAFIMVMKCWEVVHRNDSREPDVHHELEVTGEAEEASVESEIPQESRRTRAKSCLQTRRMKTWYRTDDWINTTTLVARRKNRMWCSDQGTEVTQSSPHNPELLLTCFRRLAQVQLCSTTDTRSTHGWLTCGH